MRYEFIDTFNGEDLAGVLKLSHPLIDATFWTESDRSMDDRLRVARNVRIALQKELPDYFEGLDVDCIEESGEPEHACRNTFVDNLLKYHILILHHRPSSTLEEHFAGTEDENYFILTITAGLTRDKDMFPYFENNPSIINILSDESLEETEDEFDFDEDLSSKTREQIGDSIHPEQRLQIAYIFLEFITGNYETLDQCAVKVMNEKRHADFPFHSSKSYTGKQVNRTIYLANPTKQRRENFSKKVEALENFVEIQEIADVVRRWENLVAYFFFGHLQYQSYLGQNLVRREISEIARRTLTPIEEQLRIIQVPEEVKGIFNYQRNEEQ